MQNKLQELTDRLYQEGLSKGKEEGEKLLFEAKAQADEIIAKAKAEAENIIEGANQQAADIKSKAQSDVKMASSQALQATKKDIEDLLLNSTIKKDIQKELSDTELLKQIILNVAKNFSAQESEDIALVLPQSVKKDVEPWLASELKKALGKDVQAEFSKKISGGFTIGPKDGSYFISLTDQTFAELICEYLRPVTKKILFGE